MRLCNARTPAALSYRHITCQLLVICLVHDTFQCVTVQCKWVYRVNQCRIEAVAENPPANGIVVTGELSDECSDKSTRVRFRLFQSSTSVTEHIAQKLADVAVRLDIHAHGDTRSEYIWIHRLRFVVDDISSDANVARHEYMCMYAYHLHGNIQYVFQDSTCFWFVLGHA